MSKKINVVDIKDVATKGGAIGVVSYLMSTWEVDPALNVVVLPAILYVLNVLSTKIGDPQIANFFAKQSKVVEAAVKETVARPTSVAKIPAVKKAAPKNKKK
ncbi:hypothetical protein EB001_22440 [bacterium]|nr:hypothetical protein [bacterium]